MNLLAITLALIASIAGLIAAFEAIWRQQGFDRVVYALLATGTGIIIIGVIFPVWQTIAGVTTILIVVILISLYIGRSLQHRTVR